MEDNEYDRLSALMHAIEPPAAHTDINSILDAGRRGQRRQRLALAMSAAAITAVVLLATVGTVGVVRGGGERTPANSAPHTTSVSPTASPSPPPSGTASCTIQQLPSPAGVDADMLVADPTGRYQAGQTSVGDYENKPVLWTDGVPALLNAPTAILNSSYNVAGVNSRGELAITSGESAVTTWRYHDGTFTRLPKPPGYPSTIPLGIGPNGDIVGWADSGGGAPAAVLWPADRPGSVRKLTAPNGHGATAVAIDAEGVIGGSIGDAGGPFVWDANGHGHALKVPSGYHGGMVTALDGQWAVGWVAVNADDLVAARWNLSTGKVTVFADQDQAVAVNAHGDFVGGNSGSGAAGYMFRAGKFELLPAPVGDPQTQPLAISADGKTISGTAWPWGSGPTVNLIWHC